MYGGYQDGSAIILIYTPTSIRLKINKSELTVNKLKEEKCIVVVENNNFALPTLETEQKSQQKFNSFSKSMICTMVQNQQILKDQAIKLKNLNELLPQSCVKQDMNAEERFADRLQKTGRKTGGRSGFRGKRRYAVQYVFYFIY